MTITCGLLVRTDEGLSNGHLIMKIVIQYGREAHLLEIFEDGEELKVDGLMGRIEEEMGVFKRNQRLILKGKTLIPGNSLSQAKAGYYTSSNKYCLCAIRQLMASWT